MPIAKPLTNEDEAIERALELTGFDELSDVKTSAERVTIRQDDTPFLWRTIVGRLAWRVKIEQVSLQLPSATPGFKDEYQRTFQVQLDANTGTLLGITSKYDGKAPDMRPAPSAQVAEDQLRPEEEMYHQLPDVDPKLRLLDALDVVLAKGIGSPFVAKEIHAVYVMHSRMGSDQRAVWAITLRGLPPMQAHGPYADSVPAWQRNHMRNVIDAMTGESLFATNSPQPV